jgi:hypothetical protein
MRQRRGRRGRGARVVVTLGRRRLMVVVRAAMKKGWEWERGGMTF